MALAAPFCAILCLLSAFALQAHAQAVPAGTGSDNSADQPLPGQMLGTSLTLNQGVNATSAENASFDRFGLGLSAEGGGETNFLGTSTGQLTAGYTRFGASVGFMLRSPRSQYFALYQPQYTVYPQFTEIDSLSQQAFQSVSHVLSDRAGVAWDTTAARYLSLNQYLPQALAIGSVGVIVPTLGSQLRQDSFEVTNLGTSLRYRYLASERITFTGTMIGSFFLQVPVDVAPGSNRQFSERFVATGADLTFDYQWTARDTVGVELTPIYIYGIRPRGHDLAETVLGKYQRRLGATWAASIAAGPLFVQASGPEIGSIRDNNYALNVGVSHQIRQSQLSAGYSRSFIVNLMTTATVGNSVNFNANIPLHKRWIATSAASYSQQSGKNTYSGHIAGGSAQLAYQFQRRLQFYAVYSVMSEHFSDITANGPSQVRAGFTRNQFGGGIRFNLGNSITQGGAQ